jgi:hypothetical protein
MSGDLLADFLRILFLVVLDLDLEKQMRANHTELYMVTCKICATRRPRRRCPAVLGEICSPCCGREREMTLHCPLDCEYLREARKHERPVEANPDEFPNRDIRITDTFLEDHDALLVASSRAVLDAAFSTPGAVDGDLREAFAALIRTQRTLDSGLYYETRPDNPVAAELCRRIQADIEEFRRAETEKLQMTKTRDADVLGALIFLQRIELKCNNGRKLGRAFIDFLRGRFPDGPQESAPAATSSLIVA